VPTWAADAENVALLEPAGTEIDDWTVRFELSLESATAAPPVGAALLSVTMQLVVPGVLTVLGLHARLLTCNVAGAATVMVAVLEEALTAAVIVTVVLLVTLPAVAEKFAEALPAATVTEDGTVSAELSSEIATACPPVGAEEVNVTVQLEVPGPITQAGLQVRPLNWGVAGAVTVTVAVLDEPLAVAVTVTVVLLVTLPAVAEKFADVLPAGTVTEDGTVSAELLSESDTACPPAGARALSVTVHVLVAPCASDEGEQLSADTVAVGAGGVTAPPVVDVEIASPARDAAAPPVT